MKHGALLHFLRTQNLDNSLLIGFYGGGNYGDELLMEVLAGLLQKQGVRRASIAYQQPMLYDKFHHDFGFERINMHKPTTMLRAMFAKKNLVVGGGGLWGMDSNLNILVLSFCLWVSRFIFRKRVYLLAVGYYNSAPRMGKVSAWFAAKAANLILARDEESYDNFRRLQSNTAHDTDIAWYIDDLQLDRYQKDLAMLEEELHISPGKKTMFVTLRRFRDQQYDHLVELIQSCLTQNTDKQIIIALMEPRHVDPEGFRQLRQWKRDFSNVQVTDCGFNPLALFLFFRKYHNQLVFIGPQFHGILSAHLNGIPFLPLAYDNKVKNLLRDIAPRNKPLSIHDLQLPQLQQFIDKTYATA